MSDPEPDAVYYNVSKMIIYPHFALNPIRGDIALLQLASHVTYTDTILPICLPSPDVNLYMFKVCVDTGFGFIHSTGQ